MKIKRVFAKDMRAAMRAVREEHGPEAVILSSRNVEGGVEVISAVDYDEQAVRAAAEERARQTESAEGGVSRTLGRTPSAPAPAAGKPSRGTSRFSVTVGDDDEIPSLRFEGEAGDGPVSGGEAAASEEGRSAPRIEWTQEPAMKAMREELKTLRSLFQNQLSMMEWQHLNRSQPVRAGLLRRLHDMGFGPDVARKLADHVREGEDVDLALNQALRIAAHNLPVCDDEIIENGGVVAVIGPTGVGKTTTVAKLAARYALRHGKRHVALVTTDNFRIGGQEQLRSFARILGVPVHTASDRQELDAVLEDLSDKSLVLVDTAGMSQRDVRLAEQFQTLLSASRPVKPYLVLSANTQLASLMETLRYFRKVGPAGCIVSKVDEAGSLGPVLTAVLRSRLPVAYAANGQRVPEDLSRARGDRLLEQALALAEQHRSHEDDETLAVAFGGSGTGGYG
ncbi:MAG TPA: flagellar biosynthesis protein FlhF [Gammaproteobacteria bacterium]|nr:flagellar biosynthesis protein FlhF [Gammaproteobacteria bacterium]